MSAPPKKMRRVRTETPTEEARRVANYFLTLLPHEVQTLQIQRAQVAGYSWVGAVVVDVAADDVLGPSDAARLVHATSDMLRSWVRMGVLTRTGSGYRVADVYAAQAAVTVRRQTRRQRQLDEQA